MDRQLISKRTLIITSPHSCSNPHFVLEDFKNKRSAHYNEFLAMKEARAAGLLDDSDDEEDEENVCEFVCLHLNFLIFIIHYECLFNESSVIMYQSSLEGMIID